jgi:hypothetical protein
MTKRWVVLETGANQDYIFDSNRMRHVVGASQLVLDAGTEWVRQACQGLDAVELVQLVSGKAVLLVPSEDVGREVIRTVSRRALVDAPGLEFTGAIGPPFDEAAPYRVGTADADDPSTPPGDHVAALRRTFTEQARARAARPARQLRDPLLPWHEPCRETSLPAAGLERFGAGPDAWHPASAATLARARARKDPRTRDRLAELLGGHPELLPDLVDDLTEEGWIAVVHADGNGVGSLLHDFPDRVGEAIGSQHVSQHVSQEVSQEVSLADHARWLNRFSDRLETVTKEAFTEAVTAAVAQMRADHPDWSLKGRLLPIVLGGDDVTFACHAALALPLVRTFLREFARRTRTDETIRSIAGPNGLSAAAGIAIVKRHHPFSAAYQLAEELTSSAKRNAVRRVQPGDTDTSGDGREGDGREGGGGKEDGDRGVQVSAYDVHVAHESTLRELRELRDDLTVDVRPGNPVARPGGPYVVVTDDDPVPAALAHRDERHLLAVMRLLASGTLSSARAHDLRGALDRGVAEYRSRVAVALARTAREHDHRGEVFDRASVEKLLAVVDDGADRTPFVRLPDALLLHGVLPRGQAREQARDPERDQERTPGAAPAANLAEPEVAR